MSRPNGPTPPQHCKLAFSKEQIDQTVSALGARISTWTESVRLDSHTDVLVVPVLRGALLFAADLVRAISSSLEIFPVRSIGYDPTKNASREEAVALLLEGLGVTGRRVLIVDDICDSGATFNALTDQLKEMGALEVRTAVLIHRETEESTFKPDYVGFSYSGREWFVGYGMDDADRFRNLPDVYIIQQAA